MVPRELTTRRLLLRQWRDEDAEPLHEIYAQPEYLETMPPLDLDGTRAQVERWQRPGTRTATASGRPATSSRVA